MNEDFDIRQEMVSPAEKEFEKALRPLKFSDFSGQNGVVENLEVFVEAANIVANRSTIRSSMVRRDWVRPR